MRTGSVVRAQIFNSDKSPENRLLEQIGTIEQEKETEQTEPLTIIYISAKTDGAKEDLNPTRIDSFPDSCRGDTTILTNRQRVTIASTRCMSNVSS